MYTRVRNDCYFQAMDKNDPRLKNLKPFTTDRKESCTAQINVRIPPSQKAKLKHVEGWQEEVRKLIDELTDSVPA